MGDHDKLQKDEFVELYPGINYAQHITRVKLANMTRVESPASISAGLLLELAAIRGPARP
jgi:hypothetical protein